MRLFAPSHCPFVQPRPRSAGFTLIEILVVLAIIGLLFGLTVANIDSLFGGAKIKTAEIFVNQSMSTSLLTYKIANGDYPSTVEGIAALVVAPANKPNWRGPYIKETTQVPILDPWGEPYQYRYPGTKNKSNYDLYSKGPYKIDGNEDDIGNWAPPAALNAPK